MVLFLLELVCGPDIKAFTFRKHTKKIIKSKKTKQKHDTLLSLYTNLI